MEQKKETEKKDVKVQDLPPKKDAKGGAVQSAAGSAQALNRSIHTADGAGGVQLDRAGQQQAE